MDDLTKASRRHLTVDKREIKDFSQFTYGELIILSARRYEPQFDFAHDPVRKAMTTGTVNEIAGVDPAR